MIIEHRIIVGCCTVILSYIAVKFILKVSKLKKELREQPDPDIVLAEAVPILSP